MNSGQTMSSGAKTFQAGTLIYSKSGLFALFGWLLWGDFVFTLMEALMPSLLPILLKANQATNQQIIIITTTIYTVANAMLNPVISYQSDRLRTRWGRRRPFIVATTPLIVIFLALVPFAPDITQWLVARGAGDLLSVGGVAPVIIVFGVLVGGFQIFNMFISSVYYYLIPDVVPGEVIGRFYGLFRICGAAAGIVFNYFIFGLAESHMREIFVTIALVYGLCILLMCWRVKEGEYPPIVNAKSGSWWSGIATYAKECFGRRYWWWVFLTYGCFVWAGASNVFAVFFFRENLGFSLDLLGKAGAAGGVAFMLAAYPFGILIDRIGPHKALLFALVFASLVSAFMFVFAAGTLTGIVFAVLRTVSFALISMSLMKWTVDVYPRERYGQFGSAGALFASLGGIVLGPLCGLLMDRIGKYEYFLAWSTFFTLIGTVFAVMVWRRVQKQAIDGESQISANQAAA